MLAADYSPSAVRMQDFEFSNPYGLASASMVVSGIGLLYLPYYHVPINRLADPPPIQMTEMMYQLFAMFTPRLWLMIGVSIMLIAVLAVVSQIVLTITSHDGLFPLWLL